LRGSDASAYKAVGIETSIFKNNETARIGGLHSSTCKMGVPFIRLLILGLFLDEAKRKAPYFKRSTVLFWWRIAGSNR
jgi:hypothetical protein